jgi:hypothetical protein
VSGGELSWRPPGRAATARVRETDRRQHPREKSTGLSRSELRPVNAGQAAQWRGRLGRGILVSTTQPQPDSCLLEHGSWASIPDGQSGPTRWSVELVSFEPTFRERFAASGSRGHRHRSRDFPARQPEPLASQVRDHDQDSTRFQHPPRLLYRAATAIVGNPIGSALLRRGRRSAHFRRWPDGRRSAAV